MTTAALHRLLACVCGVLLTSWLNMPVVDAQPALEQPIPSVVQSAKKTNEQVASDSAGFGKQAGIDNQELASRAAKILDRYCYRCHRGVGSSSGRYAFDAKSVTSMVEDDIITPGSAASSQLLDSLNDGRMPPRNQGTLPRPTPQEVAIIRAWIDNGADVFPKPERRPFKGFPEVMEQIYKHFQTLEPSARLTTRYFTLVNLHNDASIDERHLRMTRAGLAKALNSLSWQPDLVIPQPIDPEHLIYAVDIVRLGWTRRHWLKLVEEYPYEIDVQSILAPGGTSTVSELSEIENQMAQLSNNDRSLKHLRADWFIAVALRPTLYHAMLYDLTLPDLIARKDDAANASNPKSMTDRDLEAFLKIDVNRNIFSDSPTVARAGFVESGISEQNRMLERHPLADGAYYWKSYDFLKSNARANLTEFPLGPRSKENAGFAFEHDGGEIIFSLPNGLQGYLLASSAGGRLEAGPIEIVGDALKTSGNQLIVNGLSCIVCHRRGMIEPPDDIVRGSSGAFGVFADSIRKLYPEQSNFSALIEQDTERFLSSLEDLLQSSLLVGEDSDQTIEDLPEPIGEVSKRYLLEPMTLVTVAAELFHPDTDRLRMQIAADLRARQIGLGHLVNGTGTLKREAWQNREGRTMMQQAADILGYAPQ